MLGMAGFAIFLLVVLSLVSFVASIWLIVVAFRKSLPWGFAVLFLPFAAIVFAVLHWQDAKKPFLISVAATVAAVVVVMGTIGFGAAAMSKQMADSMSKEMAEAAAEGRSHGSAPARVEAVGESETLLAEAGDLEASLPPSLSVSAPAARAAFPPPRPVSKPDALEFDGADITSDGYAEVPLRDAKRAVGRQVRIVARNGEVHEGDLVRATSGSVEIEHAFRAGTISVEYGKSEIGKLLVKVVP